jgi:hypothetical protein
LEGWSRSRLEVESDHKGGMITDVKLEGRGRPTTESLNVGVRHAGLGKKGGATRTKRVASERGPADSTQTGKSPTAGRELASARDEEEGMKAKQQIPSP